jgi:hypothetical protein
MGGGLHHGDAFFLRGHAPGPPPFSVMFLVCRILKSAAACEARSFLAQTARVRGFRTKKVD